MTWVIGVATPFGYGAAISDIQVTWPESGRTLDCLRKVYALSPFFVGGFAGSVSLGFQLLGDMASCLRTVDPGYYIPPRAFANKWYRRARRYFWQQSSELQ